MPAQSLSCYSPSPSSTEIMPYQPVTTPGVLYGILESSFLTMTLKHHHIHAISEIHNCYILDFYLASGMWRVLKDLSRSIHKAADPDVDPFESLPSYLNPSRLCELEMPSPRILQIENFSQNMLLSSTTIEEVCRLFNIAQAIGVETVEWIAEAKSDVVYLGDRMVRIGTVRNAWILTAFLFWKDSCLFWNPHSNLAILTPSYCTHTIRIKPELRFLLYSCRWLNFPNHQLTLLWIMMPTSTLPTLFAIWTLQSNRDWGGYVMDIVYTTHILLRVRLEQYAWWADTSNLPVQSKAVRKGMATRRSRPKLFGKVTSSVPFRLVYIPWAGQCAQHNSPERATIECCGAKRKNVQEQ